MGSGGSKPKPNAQQNPAPPANYSQDPYQQQQQQYQQQQQAMNNSQVQSPPVRSNTKPSSIPPVDNQPVRQKTQVNPAQPNPMPQSQTPATQSVPQSMPQSMRSMSQPVLPQVEPMKGSLVPKRIMTENEEMPPQEQEDAPSLLFLFDFTEKVFYYYNTVSNEWKYNDLTSAMDNCPRCPLMKYKQEGEEAAAVQFGKYMSYIALSDETVYLVGGYNSFFSCLVYDIKKNSFVTCSPINVCRNNPTLCRFNGFIYAVSGDQIDSYSSEVSVYDTQNDEWTALPDLPYPQGFSSASVIFGKKLAVLGGLTIKFPRTYTPLLSLYTFGQHDWEVFDLTKVFTQRIPRFINCAMVQNREGDLIILGCEGTKNVFKFDLDNLQLTSCGKIPEEDTFAMPMRSKEALFRNNLVHCLSHKLELKVYQGYLTLEKWEVV